MYFAIGNALLACVILGSMAVAAVALVARGDPAPPLLLMLMLMLGVGALAAVAPLSYTRYRPAPARDSVATIPAARSNPRACVSSFAAALKLLGPEHWNEVACHYLAEGRWLWERRKVGKSRRQALSRVAGRRADAFIQRTAQSAMDAGAIPHLAAAHASALNACIALMYRGRLTPREFDDLYAPFARILPMRDSDPAGSG